VTYSLPVAAPCAPDHTLRQTHVSEDDAARISKHLGMSRDTFYRLYTKRDNTIPGWRLLKDREPLEAGDVSQTSPLTFVCARLSHHSYPPCCSAMCQHSPRSTTGAVGAFACTASCNR
jgi:hypothetical protein